MKSRSAGIDEGNSSKTNVTRSVVAVRFWVIRLVREGHMIIEHGEHSKQSLLTIFVAKTFNIFGQIGMIDVFDSGLEFANDLNRIWSQG